MKFSYDARYSPPAPSVEIWLASPDEPFSHGPYPAFIDTGADMSLIPIKYVKPLQNIIDDHRYLRSQWGERRKVAIYSLDIGIGELRLPSIEIIGDELNDELILGRNVLNKLVMTLNGLTQIVNIR